MASGVEPSDSSLTYSIQCSSQKVSSLMPITHLTHLPTHLSTTTLSLGVSFNKHRELTYWVCLEQQQDKEIPTPAHQLLNVYTEALTGFSHIYHVHILNTNHVTVSRLCPWSNLWEQERQVEPIVQGQEREVRVGASDCPGPAHRSTSGHIFPITFPNRRAHIRPKKPGLYTST